MKSRKKFLSLFTILFLTTILCTANAVPVPDSCETIENAVNINIKCEQSQLKIYNRPEKIEIIESPMAAGSPAFERLQDEINQKISEGWEAYYIRLEIPGKYIFRVNDSYEATVLFKSPLYSQGLLNAALLLAGIILVIIGVIAYWKVKSKKNTAKALFLAGVLLILFYLIQLFIYV